MSKERKKEITLILSNHFWVNNGPILSDLEELYKALKKEITDKQFSYHVRVDENDFADWVENSLLDKSCSKSLRKSKNKVEMEKAVKVCLKDYKMT